MHKVKCIDNSEVVVFAMELTINVNYVVLYKVRKKAKIIYRYDQVPHLTRDTIWESDKNTKRHTQENQDVSPFPAGDHKAARNRQNSIIKTNVKHK